MDILLFTVFFIIFGTHLVSGVSTRVRVVVPAVVRRGATVTLLCLHNLSGDQMYSVKWYRGNYEFYRFVPKERPPTQVFPLPGLEVDTNGSSGQQVTVRVLSRLVSGRFTCEASADQPTFSTATDSANLTVIELGLRRPLLGLESSVHQAGTRLRVNCSAQPTVPPPSISFYIDDVKVEGGSVQAMGPGLAVLEVLRLGSGAESTPKAHWLRCEAEVAGVYQLSSAGVPVLEHPTPASDESSGCLRNAYHIATVIVHIFMCHMKLFNQI